MAKSSASPLVRDEEATIRWLGRVWSADVDQLADFAGVSGTGRPAALLRHRSAYVSSSDSQRSALRLGMKQYSPPRLITNAGRSVRRRRITASKEHSGSVSQQVGR
jgi:hypothetical protein